MNAATSNWWTADVVDDEFLLDAIQNDSIFDIDYEPRFSGSCSNQYLTSQDGGLSSGTMLPPVESLSNYNSQTWPDSWLEILDQILIQGMGNTAEPDEKFNGSSPDHTSPVDLCNDVNLRRFPFDRHVANYGQPNSSVLSGNQYWLARPTVQQAGDAMSLETSSEFNDLSLPSNDELVSASDHVSTADKRIKGDAVKRRTQRTRQPWKGLHLWEFFRELLDQSESVHHHQHPPDAVTPQSRDNNRNDVIVHPVSCPVRWVCKEQGVFRIVDSKMVASMWGKRKRNASMTYEKLSRSLRWCRTSGFLSDLPKNGNYPKKLCFRFGHRATVAD